MSETAATAATVSSSVNDKVVQLWVHDRQYTTCHWIDPATHQNLTGNDAAAVAIDPLAARLFHGDVVSTATQTVRHSPVRSAVQLPGVLVLAGNRTYGRVAGGKRLLYRCVPDDARLPNFLVPYELKHLGFSKQLINKYVLFRCVAWNAADQHPRGELTEVLGGVDHLESFYAYQLYSKSLHASIKDLTDRTRQRLASAPFDATIAEIQRKYAVEDRTDPAQHYVFTIDPPQSVDFDDGFSVRTDGSGNGNGNGNGNGSDIVTVYVANVFVWLEHFQLWESFSNRVATIYLPDRFRRPMLPTILSDTLCSLQCHHTRFALAMEFRIEKEGGGVTPLGVPHMVAVRPAVNHAYESPALWADPHYQRLHAVTARVASARNSRDVVTWWMIHTNTYLSQYMMSVKRDGIFRVGQVRDRGASEPSVPEVSVVSEPTPSDLSDDAARVVLHWKHLMGQYVAYGQGQGQGQGTEEEEEEEKKVDYTHIWLGRASYMHMTSPIRRLVDLLNQMILFSETLSPSGRAFVAKWRADLAYINTAMRSIRKVESTCQLIHLCTTRPDVLAATHRGIVFDKTARVANPEFPGGVADGSNEYMYMYMVYLEDLKVLVRMPSSTRSVDNYSRHDFQLYLFETEDKDKKKIRVSFA